MNGTLKEKLLEFRNIDSNPFYQDIIDSELRLDFEKRLKDHINQQYRNERQLEGSGKWNVIRLHEQRRHECELLSKLKADRAAQLIANEKKETEEALAKELHRFEEEKEICSKKRLQFRNTEPELRDLALKIRQKLGGQMLASQIQFNLAQRKAEIERNLEFDKQLVEADRIADELYIKNSNARAAQEREETRRLLTEQKDSASSKRAALKAEKEDNKRLIDELVEEENRKIAEENAEKQKFREQCAKEYNQFIESQAEKIKDKEKVKEFERYLLEQQKQDFERRQEVERKKREAVENRIQLQEAVLDLTSKMREADEKERYGFLEANETIALAKAVLDERNLDKNDRIKAERNTKQLCEELEKLAEHKRKMKEEEQAEERKQDQMLLEAVAKEAAKREAERLSKQKKWTEEVNAQLELNRKIREQQCEQRKREEEEALRQQQEHQSRIEAERKAMWAEFEQYLRSSGDCE